MPIRPQFNEQLQVVQSTVRQTLAALLGCSTVPLPWRDAWNVSKPKRAPRPKKGNRKISHLTGKPIAANSGRKGTPLTKVKLGYASAPANGETWQKVRSRKVKGARDYKAKKLLRQAATLGTNSIVDDAAERARKTQRQAITVAMCAIVDDVAKRARKSQHQAPVESKTLVHDPPPRTRKSQPQATTMESDTVVHDTPTRTRKSQPQATTVETITIVDDAPNRAMKNQPQATTAETITIIDDGPKGARKNLPQNPPLERSTIVDADADDAPTRARTSQPQAEAVETNTIEAGSPKRARKSKRQATPAETNTLVDDLDSVTIRVMNHGAKKWLFDLRLSKGVSEQEAYLAICKRQEVNPDEIVITDVTTVPFVRNAADDGVLRESIVVQIRARQRGG